MRLVLAVDIRNPRVVCQLFMSWIVFCIRRCARWGLLERKWILRSSANKIERNGGLIMLVISLMASKKNVPLSGEP